MVFLDTLESKRTVDLLCFLNKILNGKEVIVDTWNITFTWLIIFVFILFIDWNSP